MKERHFSVEEADELIPWLKAKFDEIAPLRGEIIREQDEWLTLLRESRGNGHASKESDLNTKNQAIDRLRIGIQGHLQELERRGVIVKDLDRGLVDFPYLREGREVYLCWLKGESRIEYWHDTDVGFAGRQPL